MIFFFDVYSIGSFTWLQENLITEFNLQPTDTDVRCWILVGLTPSVARTSQQRSTGGSQQLVRKVSVEEAQSLAETYDMPYLEISCSSAPVALSLAAYEFAVKRPRRLPFSVKHCRKDAADALQQFVKVRDALVRLLAGVSAPVPNLKNVAAESRATIAEMKSFYRAQRGRLQDYADSLKKCARALISAVKTALMCRAPAKLNTPRGQEELSAAITQLAQCMNEIRMLSLRVICANAIL